MSEMIERTMRDYLENSEISGAALCVVKGGRVVYRNRWGYSSLEKGEEIRNDSIYRMMSMTKPVTAAAVMILIERGLIGLDDPLSEYIPEFSEMRTADDERYVFSPQKMAGIGKLLQSFSFEDVKSRPCKREITIRDLLSHSSGLQQGLCGLLGMLGEKGEYVTLHDYALHYASYVLDFDPGEGTGYSPLAGFDILAYLVSLVSGVSFEEFIGREICRPLGMVDTTFFPSGEQKKRIVDVYKRVDGHLENVTGTADDMCAFLHQKEIRYEIGSGGLYSTLDDYTRFSMMLLNGGVLDGVRILSGEGVRAMHTEASLNHLEPEPGYVWGLGVKIRMDSVKGNSPLLNGSYGWSGAFGTHFFISPSDSLAAVFMTNRTDLGGSGSYISRRVEELVAAEFSEGERL